MRASVTKMIMITAFLAAFAQELSAASIQAIRVLPTCAINPQDRVLLELFLCFGSTPPYLSRPTEIEVVGDQILIDLYATSGALLAISYAKTTIELGSYPPGTYSYIIREHDENVGGPKVVQEYTGTFEVSSKPCPDVPRDQRHLYWGDEWGSIKRATLNGSKLEGLVGGRRLLGFDLDIPRKEMYWISVDSLWIAHTPYIIPGSIATLEKAALDGSRPEILLSIEGDNYPRQLVKSERYLFWTQGPDSNSIWRSNLDGTDAAMFVYGVHGASGLLVHESQGKIYWSEGSRIRRANVNGSEVQTLVSGLYYPRLLAMDFPNSRIYWSTSTSTTVMNGLYSSNQDGTGTLPLVVNQTIAPTSLMPHVVPGKIYWTNAHPDAAIYRANADGSDVQVVVEELCNPIELTYDRQSGKLFWFDCGALASANIDGTEVAVIADGVGYAFGLSLDRTLTFRVRPKAAP